MRTIVVVALSCALSFASIRLDAHHGGAVEWQQDVAGPMTGTATEFAFRFPHVTLEMDVEGENGVEHWTLNTRWTPTILRRHGWSRDSIKPGDTVTVTYHLHVSNPLTASMQTISVNGHELPLEGWPEE